MGEGAGRGREWKRGGSGKERRNGVRGRGEWREVDGGEEDGDEGRQVALRAGTRLRVAGGRPPPPPLRRGSGAASDSRGI